MPTARPPARQTAVPTRVSPLSGPLVQVRAQVLIWVHWVLLEQVLLVQVLPLLLGILVLVYYKAQHLLVVV